MRITQFIFLFFLVFCPYLIGQTSINGVVKNKNSQNPVAFVSVAIFEKDSVTLIDQVYTDSLGQFSLTLNETSEFLIRAILFGYRNFNSQLLTKDSFDRLGGTIEMEEDINLLDEITVLYRQGFIKLKGDHITYNIEQAGIGIGNNTLEVLGRVPGLRLNKDDKVIFRGSGVQILINGREPLMQGEALTQYLKTLSGEEIRSVEVISNPSSKYEASGSGGVINIVLKKGAKRGFSGVVYSTAGYAEFGKLSSGINIYNQKNKWNMNAGAYYGYFESVNHRKIIQRNETETIVTELDQMNEWFPKNRVMSGKFGLEYLANKNNLFGTSWNFNKDLSNQTTLGRTNERTNNQLINYTILEQQAEISNSVITGSIFYSFVSDSTDANMTVQLNYANYNESEVQSTVSQFFKVNTNLQYKAPDDLIYRNPKKYELGSAKIDGDKLFNEKLSFEYGAKWNYINNQYGIQIERATENGNYTDDEFLSNQLSYNESLGAVYTNLIWNKADWNAQIGLRGEGIFYKVSANKNSSEISGKNMSLFPSYSINRSFENHQFKWSYSRRISRPTYLDRNPFFRYIDTYNISIGNPSLRPEFSNVLDFTWIIKENTNISFFANRKGNAIYDIILYNNETFITTLYKDNIAVEKGLGISASTEIELTDWWGIQLYGESIYNQAQSTLEGFGFNNGGLTGYIDLNQTFYLKGDWQINCNAFYVASGAYGNSTSLPSYDMSFSVKKSLLDEKLKFKFRAQDIFMTNRYRAVTKQGAVTTDWTNRWETRKFTISLSYSFGKGIRKFVKKTDLSDEKARL